MDVFGLQIKIWTLCRGLISDPIVTCAQTTVISTLMTDTPRVFDDLLKVKV